MIGDDCTAGIVRGQFQRGRRTARRHRRRNFGDGRRARCRHRVRLPLFDGASSGAVLADAAEMVRPSGRSISGERSSHSPTNRSIRSSGLRHSLRWAPPKPWANLPEAASEHLGEALVIHQQVGMKRETAMDHRHLGILHHRLGDSAGAIAHHRPGSRTRGRSRPAVDGDACSQVDGSRAGRYRS